MKKSTVTIVSVAVIVIFHGAQLLWGWMALVYLLASVAAFSLVTWALYWRQLRKLRESMRWLSEKERQLVLSKAQFDEEAQRDFDSLEDQERKRLETL
jgi:hypothetical protein